MPPRLYSCHFTVFVLLHNRLAIFLSIRQSIISELQTSVHPPSQIPPHVCHQSEFNICLYLEVSGNTIYSEMLKSHTLLAFKMKQQRLSTASEFIQEWERNFNLVQANDGEPQARVENRGEEYSFIKERKDLGGLVLNSLLEENERWKW